MDSVVLEESYSSRLREVYKLPNGPRTLDELAQLWNLGYSKRFAHERGKQVLEGLKRGDIVYGETKAETRHVVQLRGREKVHVNCAIDALIEGFFQDLDIESSCPHCKDSISLQMVDRRVASVIPKSTVLWLGISPQGEGPTVEVLCPFINFFTSPDHARQWRGKNPEQVGVLLTLPHALGSSPRLSPSRYPKMVRDQELAHQILDICASLKPGERVWINSWDHTLDLASALALECEMRSCPVVVTVQPEDLWLRSLIEAPLDVVDGLPAHQAALLRETDVYIYTLGPRNPIPWDKIPEDRQKLATFWFLEKNRFVEQWKAIARQRKVRMLGIEATLATPERAKALGLDFEEWNQVMFDGCMADYHDVERRGKALVSLLSGEGEVHISTPHGTDFRFRLAGRPVDYSYGLATSERVEKGNVVFLPAGGVGVTLDEGSGVGTVVFDLPVRTQEGGIEQLTLELEGGRVAHVSAERNQKTFERYLNEGKGDVDRFGFFGLGLNPNLRYGFTQDDKVLGSVEVNFGDNKDRGGKNNASNSWWACVSSATVTIDGTQVLKNGSLLV